MRDEKTKKAEILLEAIGEIEDSILSEALEYKRKPVINTRAIAMAASLVLIFCLVAASVMLPRLMTPDDGEGNIGIGDADADISQNGERYALDEVFKSGIDREKYDFVTDPETLPYHGGQVYIVWQYAGEERYYISKPLENGEFETIKYALGRGVAAGESSPGLYARVWVLLGDGRVISPYLEGSKGNISSEIFDYEVEIVPDDSFAKRILQILS